METNNKLREALEALVDVIDKCDSGSPLWWHSGAKGVKPLKDARAALAEPVKNCEVGTAKEQTIRFKKFCLDNRTKPRTYKEYFESCKLIRSEAAK